MSAKTVAITGANSLTGRRLVPLLRARGWHTVALVRTPEPLPADDVIADWLRASAARAAVAWADAVVHLPGVLQAKNYGAFVAANVVPALRVVQWLQPARSQRLIYTSYLGANERSRNLYLRTKGTAENLFRETRKEAVIFRVATILDAPESPGPLERAYAVRDGGTAFVLGSGQQRLRPIYRGDVAEAIAAALERGRPGNYDLVGPEEFTADELVELVNPGRRVRIVHVKGPVAWLLGRVHPRLNPSMVDIFVSDGTGDPEPARQEFGFGLRSLPELWGWGALTNG